MSESKPFASLGASLLARKGAARPAMRPQNQPIPGANGGMDSTEDLGWNDMGHEPQNSQPAVPLPLTPAPHNPAEDAKVNAGDRAERAKLAGHGKPDAAAPVAVPQAEKPEVRRQQEAIEAKLAPPAKMAAPAARPMASLAPAAPASPSPSAPVAELKPEPAAQPAKVASIDKARTRRARKSALESGRKAAFTLRLDAERHLKLRLACTVRNRSAQQIVTEALDQLLGKMPELENLAAQVKRP